MRLMREGSSYVLFNITVVNKKVIILCNNKTVNVLFENSRNIYMI